MRSMKLPEMIVGILGLVLSVAIFWASSSLPEFPGTATGPAFYPKVLAFILALISVVLVAQSGRGTIPHVESETPTGVTAERGRLPIVGVAIIASVVYYAGIQPFGFIIMTIAYFSFLMFLMQSKKQVPRTVLWSVGTTLFTYWVFAVLLRASLPMGTVFR